MTNQDDDPTGRSVSRRGVLGASASLLGLGEVGGRGRRRSTAAMPPEPTYVWDGYVGADDRKGTVGERGALYFASDSGDIYYFDGDGWTAIPLGSPWHDRDGDDLYTTDERGISVEAVETEQSTATTRRTEPKEITSDSADTLTAGHSLIYADTSDGPVTVELSRIDVIDDGTTVEIYDVGENAETNPITVETQVEASINPGGAGSITLDVDGGFVELTSRGGSWWTDRRRQSDVIETERVTVTDETFVRFGRKERSESHDAGEYTPVFDSVERDVRGEASDGTFTPDETGEYAITVIADLRGRAQPSDKGHFRLVENDSTTLSPETEFQIDRQAEAGDQAISHVFRLGAGETYEPVVTDVNEPYEIVPDHTSGTVRRVLTE